MPALIPDQRRQFTKALKLYTINSMNTVTLVRRAKQARTQRDRITAL
jgi:hypothetical protein